jgi:hypothetical protein
MTFTGGTPVTLSLAASSETSASNRRRSERRPMAIPARLTWKDQRGATRFASVWTRDISDQGVYVECYSSVSIPLYRLVQLQLERTANESEPVPQALKQGRVLSAVYRVAIPMTSGTRQGLALRLMVDPKRLAAEATEHRATA